VSARRADGSIAASTRSDSGGRFQLTVPAGSYTLVVDPGNVYPRCPETAVTVPAGGSATADIACDSGIR
jgi:hypothetical protein